MRHNCNLKPSHFTEIELKMLIQGRWWVYWSENRLHPLLSLNQGQESAFKFQFSKSFLIFLQMLIVILVTFLIYQLQKLAQRYFGFWNFFLFFTYLRENVSGKVVGVLKRKWAKIRFFAVKPAVLGGVLGGESIVRIPEVWKYFWECVHFDLVKVVGVLKRK